MKRKLYTVEELFRTVWKELEKTGKVLDDLVDYATPNTLQRTELKNYEFSVLGTVDYGANEGIYVNLFIAGDFGDTGERTSVKIGTIKTLSRSDDAFRMMAILMADFQLAAHRFINDNLDDFTHVGYDVTFYRSDGTRSFGMTCRESNLSFEKVAEIALQRMKASLHPLTKAVIINNVTGGEQTVLFDLSEKEGK